MYTKSYNLKGYSKAAKVIAGFFFAITTAIFCRRCFMKETDVEVIGRCNELKRKLKNLDIRWKIMESRVHENLSWFCSFKQIDTAIAKDVLIPKGRDLISHNSGRLPVAFSIAMLLGIVALLVTFKFFPEFNFIKNAHNETLNGVFVAVVLFVIVFAVVSLFSSCARQKDFNKYEKHLERTYKKHVEQYSCMIVSVRMYNSLPDAVRYSITSSDSVVWMHKSIMSGDLKEKSVRDIMEELDRVGNAMIACA